MTYEHIALDQIGRARLIKINRPDARNAINPSVIKELIEAIEKADGDESFLSIVLTGDGDKAFSAGGDLGGGLSGGALAQHHDRALFSKLIERLRGSSKPVVARLNGHALGGGFGLALACDLIVAADHAELGTPEVNIGLWPFVITAVIQRHIPPKIALEMMMLGLRITADEAQRWGMVNRVVPGSELDKATEELVNELAGKSPAVLRLGKQSFYAAEDMNLQEAMRYLEGQLTIGLSAEDALEGVQAFLQKRPPEWKGR